MNAVQITIRIRNGRRAAFYRTVGTSSWFSLPVPQATKALREGSVWIGVEKNIPVIA